MLTASLRTQLLSSTSWQMTPLSLASCRTETSPAYRQEVESRQPRVQHAQDNRDGSGPQKISVSDPPLVSQAQMETFRFLGTTISQDLKWGTVHPEEGSAAGFLHATAEDAWSAKRDAILLEQLESLWGIYKFKYPKVDGARKCYKWVSFHTCDLTGHCVNSSQSSGDMDWSLAWELMRRKYE